MLCCVGVCLLTLLDESLMCNFRHAMYIFVSGTCIVLGTFIFGLTTTQSLMKDFGYTPNAQPVIRSHCLANE